MKEKKHKKKKKHKRKSEGTDDDGDEPKVSYLALSLSGGNAGDNPVLAHDLRLNLMEIKLKDFCLYCHSLLISKYIYALRNYVF